MLAAGIAPRVSTPAVLLPIQSLREPQKSAPRTMTTSSPKFDRSPRSIDPPTKKSPLLGLGLESCLYLERLKSYGSDTAWPHAWLAPEDLAKAGFCYKPNRQSKDRVRCYDCSLSLDEWVIGDIPIKEHLAHQPTCHYLERFRARNPGTLEQHEEELQHGKERKSSLNKQARRQEEDRAKLEQEKERAKQARTQHRHEAHSANANQLLINFLEQQYDNEDTQYIKAWEKYQEQQIVFVSRSTAPKSYDTRLASCTLWPNTCPKASDMGTAEFHRQQHSERQKLVVCSQRNLSLSNWEHNGDPLDEHVRRSPKFSFLHTPIEQSALAAVQKTTTSAKFTLASPTSIKTSPIPAVVSEISVSSRPTTPPPAYRSISPTSHHTLSPNCDKNANKVLAQTESSGDFVKEPVLDVGDWVEVEIDGEEKDDWVKI